MEVILRRFYKTDAVEVLSWVRNEQEQLYWCGVTQFPLQPSVLEKWHAEDYVTPYILLRNDEPVAYGELWSDEDEVELARLIVRPEARRMGHGQNLVKRLTDMALQSGRKQVFMRVFPENATALKCYSNAGFKRLTQEQQTLFNEHQPSVYDWLVYTRPEFE